MAGSGDGSVERKNAKKRNDARTEGERERATNEGASSYLSRYGTMCRSNLHQGWTAGELSR